MLSSSAIEQSLMGFSFFKGVNAADIRATVTRWTPRTIKPGQVLWRQGESVHELALVVDGRLTVEVDGMDLGLVTLGEMVGEASVFLANSVRSATLRAPEAATVVTLSMTALRDLRDRRSPVYYALLDQALITLARRVRTTDREIAKVTKGSVSAPSRAEPSMLARLWRALRPGSPTTSAPDLATLLRAEPGLNLLSVDHMKELVAAFHPEPVEEGKIIFLEGDVGAACYIIAEGQIDVLRHVRGDRAERLASLGVGDIFGINTLIEHGNRTASCVSMAPGWLFRMDAEDAQKLSTETRLLWRESMLASLATQIRNANRLLQRMMGGASPLLMSEKPPKVELSGSSFNELLRASGYLEGVSRNSDLDKIEVVVSEDQRRHFHGSKGV